MIGHSEVFDARRALDHWKAHGIDLSRLLHRPKVDADVAIRNTEQQDHGLDKALDNQLIAAAKPALDSGKPVRIELPVRNVNRTIGAMLSGEVAKRYGHAGLPPDTIGVKMTGTAGQSFGAFLARGVSLELIGEANDYVGKGLSGGRIAVYPSPKASLTAVDNIIVGNTVMYGAVAGECYFAGVAGERFAVRNSGAYAVVEGVGDHGCEYMTGGVAVVLGQTGRNFAAGMSGGIAYVLDEQGLFDRLCNRAMVEIEPVRADAKQATPVNGMDEDNLMADMLSHDAFRLRRLIERHLHYTNSKRARDILARWDHYLPKFVKVMPTDFRRALSAAEAEARPAKKRAAGGAKVRA
jgi:glutamate synthase (NADPH/NADH) large chain